MTKKARALLILLACIMLSLWLSGLSTILVISSNGLSGVPGFVNVLVDAAYWPTMLLGTPRHLVFYGGRLFHIAINAGNYLMVRLAICVLLKIGSGRRQTN